MLVSSTAHCWMKYRLLQYIFDLTVVDNKYVSSLLCKNLQFLNIIDFSLCDITTSIKYLPVLINALFLKMQFSMTIILLPGH